MPDLPEARMIDPDDLTGPVRSLFHLPATRLEALQAMTGAALLIDVFADQEGVYLVGGAVRDLLLGSAQFDLDVLVEGDALAAAERLVAAHDGAVTSHERFLTANYRSADGALKIDFARARSERYGEPGALPDVSPAELELDLARRDFTVNALAVALWRDALGKVFEFPGASEDLKARVLRVTHDQSFHDDPTRLLRLLRYGARLGFSADPHTEQLAREAVKAGVVSRVGGSRIRDELLDLLGERLAVVAIEAMAALGLDQALNPNFVADEYVAARVLAENCEGSRQDLLLLAACSRSMDDAQLTEWLEFLKLRRAQIALVSEAVKRAPTLLADVATAEQPSELDALLRPLKSETILLAIALPGADRASAAKAREWLDSRRDCALEVSGADLRAAGVPEGPLIGRALAETLAAALDGKIGGRAEQLAHAIAVANRSEEAE